MTLYMVTFDLSEFTLGFSRLPGIEALARIQSRSEPGFDGCPGPSSGPALLSRLRL